MFVRFFALSFATSLILMGCGSSVGKNRGGVCNADLVVHVIRGYERTKAISLYNDKVASKVGDDGKPLAAPRPAPGAFASTDTTTQLMGEQVTRECTKDVRTTNSETYSVQYTFQGEKCPIHFELGTQVKFHEEDLKKKLNERRIVETKKLLTYAVAKPDFGNLSDIVEYSFTTATTTEVVDGRNISKTTRDGSVVSVGLGRVKLTDKETTTDADRSTAISDYALDLGDCKSKANLSANTRGKITIDGTEYDF